MSPVGAFPLGMLIYYLVCSEIDAAIHVYERAIEQRYAMAAMWASAGFLRPLRSSPRWPELARMMNLAGNRLTCQQNGAKSDTKGLLAGEGAVSDSLAELISLRLP